MIKVNLLPNEMRPIQRTPVPHIISLAVLAAAVLFMVQVFLSLQSDLTDVNTQITQQQASLDGLAAVIAEYNELMSQKLQLQEKIITIEDILEDRTIWSEQLHRLATLTPENIWYKRIRLLSRRVSEERPQIDPRTGRQEMDPRTQRPRTTRVQVERILLEISGYAIDDETGISSTYVLANNTAVDPEFSNMFTLTTSRIADTEFNGFPVREFTFEYVVSG